MTMDEALANSFAMPVATTEQKDCIGLAYLAKILGIEETTTRDFVTCDLDAYFEVARRFNDHRDTRADFASFWQAVNQLCDGYYNPQEIALLVSYGRDAVEYFILELETPFHEESFVMHLLTTARSSTCFKEEQRDDAR